MPATYAAASAPAATTKAIPSAATCCAESAETSSAAETRERRDPAHQREGERALGPGTVIARERCVVAHDADAATSPPRRACARCSRPRDVDTTWVRCGGEAVQGRAPRRVEPAGCPSPAGPGAAWSTSCRTPRRPWPGWSRGWSRSRCSGSSSRSSPRGPPCSWCTRPSTAPSRAAASRSWRPSSASFARLGLRPLVRHRRTGHGHDARGRVPARAGTAGCVTSRRRSPRPASSCWRPTPSIQTNLLVSRLLDTTVGVVVGLLVNLLVWPPLRDRAAWARADELPQELAAVLAEMAHRPGSGPRAGRRRALGHAAARGRRTHRRGMGTAAARPGRAAG